MPTNENTYNSRVTSEALEAKFRSVFPSQGGAELVDDLYASGVIQPVIDFSSVAEGSVLATNLQTAWDFSTGHQQARNSSHTIITNTGFWQIDLNSNSENAGGRQANLRITDGLANKIIWQFSSAATTTTVGSTVAEDRFVVFLRAGDSLVVQSFQAEVTVNVNWRQIADVNGNLVNPLGFTFS